MVYYNKRSLFRHGQSCLRVHSHYAKLPTSRRMAKVAYGWTVTMLSYLQVYGHYAKLPMGRRMAKVAYEWTVTTLSHLRVDAWPKSPMGGQSLR